MKVSEAFLVNTKNFKSIIETLVEYEAEEPVINSALLEELGYSDPNDLLVVRILKDFCIIDNDGKPSKYYEEFNNPNTTKLALAKGLVTAYQQLFENDSKIHKASPDDIKEAFEELFQGKKTDLIVKYISGTFQKIVSYVGGSAVDKALQSLEKESELEASVVGAEEVQSGNSKNGTHTASENNSKASGEEISDKNIDDLVNDFDAKKSEENPSEENPSSDDDSNLTVHEYMKGEEPEEVEEDNIKEEEEEDPFNFGEIDDSSEAEETESNDTQIDVDPVDLDIPLSTATENSDSMEPLTAEHEFVQKALVRKSDLLHKMQRWDELVHTVEEIIKRYDDEEHKELNEAVSRSIIRRAIALLKLNKAKEALPALSAVIDRFKDSENKEFFDQASRAMLYKANILEKQGAGNLLPLYNAIIDRLDSNSDLLMKERLDQIHLNRFDLIISKGQNSEILDACQKLIERFKDNKKHVDYLQKAMIIRAEMLDKMDKDEEALAAYDEFLSVFGN